MDDLVQFLRDRLDEDAAVAQTAASKDGGGTWEAGTDCNAPWVSGPPQPGSHVVPLLVEFGYGNPDDYERAVHIARHDPARVLREVETKRRVLDEHAPRRVKYLPNREPGCLTCTTAQEWDERAGEANCLTLRLLSLPYAEHPGYRGHWRP